LVKEYYHKGFTKFHKELIKGITEFHREDQEIHRDKIIPIEVTFKSM